jgi:hypothetical protein
MSSAHKKVSLMSVSILLDSLDIARLRGVLAARRITHTQFARACGLSIAFTSRVLCGYPAGELCRFKMARGLQHFGLEAEVRRAS